MKDKERLIDNALFFINEARSKLVESRGLGKKKRVVIDNYIDYAMKAAIEDIKRLKED